MAEADLSIDDDGGGETVTLIDGEGNFTPDFTKALPGYLGKETLTKDDGSPIKMFENTPSIGSLVKLAYGAKTDLGKKMENAIQKPAEGAGDDVIAKYMAELDTARGVPSEAQNYEFPFSEGQTEEDTYTEDEITAYKEFAKEHSFPAETFSEFVLLNRQFTQQKTANALQNIKDAEDETIKFIKEKNPGKENLDIAGKRVFNALSKFNANNPEFLAKLKENKVFENPADFENWKKAGVTPQNFRAWLGIATEMKISHSVSGDPGGGGGGELSDLLPASAKVLGDK